MATWPLIGVIVVTQSGFNGLVTDENLCFKGGSPGKDGSMGSGGSVERRSWSVEDIFG